ncbi:MAG: NAD(P)/FAD-dependent oxidoreductase [Acidimicrobiales bacterium]
MVDRIVILGGGTGGTLLANRLRRTNPADALAITVVDADNRHLYQPGLLFVPFGQTAPETLTRDRRRQLLPGIEFRQSAVERVDVDASVVHLADGSELGYEVAVVASGARLAPEETAGLQGPGWMERVFTFYDLAGASALAGALAKFERGRITVAIVDMPIKCPVAPLEFCFLADAFFRRRGLRQNVDIALVTPLDGAFTKPVASRRLGGLLAQRGIELVTEFNTASVDGSAGTVTSYDERVERFDLAVVVPLHVGADFVGSSPGLGDEFNFVPCDPATLQAKAAPNVFAIGDATDVPTSKAGSVTHFEGEIVAENIGHFLRGEPLGAAFDGHANCFVETGSGRAILIDFNYDTEPLPGRFPGPVGLPLLQESRMCHVAKRAFSSVYWHLLVPGRDIPMIHAAMPRTGKALAAHAGEER